jgi:hypothetical protein
VREQHVVERLLHLLLVDRVQRTRRLVEQQDRGLADDRARDGEALLLPARQLHPLLA